MSEGTLRRTTTTTETVVRHTARPMGEAQENGPHLGDLREFVARCEGLPDDVLVHVESGQLSEGGRRVVTLSLRYRHPAEDES